MPFISDTASAIKSRFGFSNQPSEPVPLVQNTPDLHKSTAKKNLAHQLVSVSSIPSIGEWDDEGDGAGTSTQSFELREDPSFWKDHNVQVIIRVRPLSSSEISTQGYSKCVRQESSQTVTWTGPPPSRFTFDHVADENVSQEKLFKVAGVPMVENCVEGYNSCMFAYGQTGSGKTHTMLGDIEGGTRRHSVNCGMTPRVFEYLFSRIQKEREARREEKLRFICKCSFLEIYNEHILDLLEPSTNNLQIREDIKKGIHVENLKEVEVTSARDVMQQLIQGASNRKVAATNMNRASSRSHSVFTCIIESKWESQGVNHHRFARLNLVDLAGSERQKSSGAEGDRLKEATNINKSLSTLGLVIMNLVNISNGKSQHVPYRDSKLTFLLQDSLGGNSKTIIIANISPANSCLLETLSTLKFAQRAKFIKNNAIVNEDASGDVIAMRMQIQQLKKEVSRLRSLGNGGGVDNQDNDALTVNFPGSPGSSKWEGLFGSFSPLATAKKTSQKKDYEVALVGAFRREKDKDLALQALAAEIQGAMQLAKQREDENQGLKMRLRFRESAIKRLEAVASGKISAETHLLKEKEEHLKVIEVLKTQVDRNQEVTRFAMENLRLKEEIRRLKSFCEQGERETMSEQISVLHNMLVEALDWKLMHESDPTAIQNSNSAGQALGDGNLLGTSQEPGTPWRSSIEGENEFLRLQAIQNQSEMDSLHKKLNNCLEEKEKLERRVNELVKELEVERSSRVTKEGTQEIEHQSLSTDAPIINFDDQMEIKTMVDAIASASEREAEAHERAIILAKENDELRTKFMVLLEDNNKLIELYEQAAAESKHNNVSKAKIAQLETEVCQSSELAEGKETETKKMVQNLEHQLMEMNEENEKLMGLYEKAMHERDEFKRMLSSNEEEGAQTREQFDCSEKFVEVNEGQRVDELDTVVSDEAKDVMEDDRAFSCMETDEPDIKSAIVPEDLNLAKKKLEEAQEALSDSARSVSLFGSLEKAIIEVDEVTKEIEAMANGVQVKQQQLESLKFQSSELCERSSLVNKKFSALKYSLSNFSSSFLYFEQREARARARVGQAMSNLNQKKQELARLEAKRDETEASLKKVQQSDVELRNNLVSLKTKFEEEESKRQENNKVLFAIDNVEKVDPAQRNWNLGGKATELLKSEEEKPKLQGEMKLVREKLGVTRREYEDLDRKLTKIKGEIQAVQKELQKGTQAVEEMELALKNVLEEKEMLMEVKEEGKNEIEIMILDYQQHVFESDLKEEEKKMLEEELVIELKRVEELQKARAEATEKMTLVLEQGRFGSSFVSEKMVEELNSVNASVLEAKTLLGEVS